MKGAARWVRLIEDRPTPRIVDQPSVLGVGPGPALDARRLLKKSLQALVLGRVAPDIAAEELDIGGHRLQLQLR